MKCNIVVEEEVKKVVSQVVEKFGGIDAVVNCAGVMDGFGELQS